MAKQETETNNMREVNGKMVYCEIRMPQPPYNLTGDSQELKKAILLNRIKNERARKSGKL